MGTENCEHYKGCGIFERKGYCPVGCVAYTPKLDKTGELDKCAKLADLGKFPKEPDFLNKKKAGDTQERGKVLKEAFGIINGERQDDYGNPEDSFRIIAEYWSTYLSNSQVCTITVNDVDVELEPINVSDMMVLFKQARKLGQKPCIDNYRDAAGYEGIGGDIVAKTIED